MTTSRQLTEAGASLDRMAGQIRAQANAVGRTRAAAADETVTMLSAWSGPRASVVLEPTMTYLTDVGAFPAAADAAATTVEQLARFAQNVAAEMARCEAISETRIVGTGPRVFDEEYLAAQAELMDLDATWRRWCRTVSDELLSAIAKLESIGRAKVLPELSQPRTMPAWMFGGLAGLTDPREVAGWWASLTWEQQLWMLDRFPERIGNLDGVPATMRDAANRRNLVADWQQLTTKAASSLLTPTEMAELRNIRRVREILADRESHNDPITGRPVVAQLYIYDPGAFGGDGRLAISIGDLDTAEHTVVSVPGLGTTISSSGGGGVKNVYDETRWATQWQNNDPTSTTDEPYDESVAVLEWVGYDAPSAPRPGLFGSYDLADLGGVTNTDKARAGGTLLATDVEGLRSMRGEPRTHLTVWGNSYGSTTTAVAATEFNLDADDVVLTASPGAGPANSADDFTTGSEHTWAGSASTDFVSMLGADGHDDDSAMRATFDGGLLDGLGVPNGLGVNDEGALGVDPTHHDFGARRFEAERIERGESINTRDHSNYDNEHEEALYNVAAVGAGSYDDVNPAPHRIGTEADPFTEPKDPEFRRPPRDLTHRPPER